MIALTDGQILRFVDRLERDEVCMHGFELRQGGDIRAQGDWRPFDRGEPHRMYSVSKSMVSLAVGLLAGEGLLRLDDPIVRYFPDLLPPHPDERLTRLCISDMLRMATCHRATTYKTAPCDCWAASFFTVAPTHEPGTLFQYDTSATQVLGVLCERLSGQGLLEFLQNRVFDAAGATGPKKWLTDPSGAPQGGSGLMMTLEDLGKVAQLIMDGGRGVLDKGYLSLATTRRIDTPLERNPEERHGYGWQFWMTRSGWAMYGMGGQLAVAWPQRDLLLCTTADTRLDAFGVQRIYDAFFESFSQPEEAPAGRGQLRERLDALEVRGVRHDPGARMAWTGTYRVASNTSGLEAVAFGPNEVRLEWKHGVHVFAWGAPGCVQKGVFSGTQVPTLTSAGVSSGMLRVRCQLIGERPGGIEMLFAAQGPHLTIRLRGMSDPYIDCYDGWFCAHA